MSDNQIVQMLMDALNDFRKETREDIKGIYKRLDAFMSREFVEKPYCEQCRKECKRGGIPPITAFLGSLVICLLTVILTKAFN